MRKNQTLLVAGILLLASTAVAQAQGVYEIFSNAVNARTGGAAELSGDVVVFPRGGMNAGGDIILKYSAPLAKGTAPTVTINPNDGMGTATPDEDENTVTITMPTTGTSVTLRNVRLDLREAEAPVTITASGGDGAFVSGVANVISEIRDALVVTSTPAQILTRGGMGSATVTLKEAFASAFTVGAEVKLTLVGVPNKASLTVSHAGHPTETALNADMTLDDADVAGNVTLNGAETMIVTNAETTGAELAMTGDGDKLNIIVGFTMPNAASTESVTLMFDIMVTSDQKDLMLPLDEGVVEVLVTMGPDEAADVPDGSTTDEYFALNYIPADGVVAFTIAPASCTLLYPYVTYNFPYMVDTGIAVTNPTGFGGDALSGPITFHLFGNDSEPESYTTDAGTPGGMDSGLDENGNLAAGKTYSVLLSQLMLWKSIEGVFEGHVYVETDFTRCSGLGLVWDNNGTFSQGYIPELIADEVTAGEKGRTVNPQ